MTVNLASNIGQIADRLTKGVQRCAHDSQNVTGYAVTGRVNRGQRFDSRMVAWLKLGIQKCDYYGRVVGNWVDCRHKG